MTLCIIQLFSYLQHGADIIITNSYQASIELFTKHLNMSPCEGLDLIGRSASLAKEARDWFVKQPEVSVFVIQIL